jgi:hypothetical protein
VTETPQRPSAPHIDLHPPDDPGLARDAVAAAARHLLEDSCERCEAYLERAEEGAPARLLRLFEAASLSVAGECLDDDELRDFAGQALSIPDLAAAALHVSGCVPCRKRLEGPLAAEAESARRATAWAAERGHAWLDGRPRLVLRPRGGEPETYLGEPGPSSQFALTSRCLARFLASGGTVELPPENDIRSIEFSRRDVEDDLSAQSVLDALQVAVEYGSQPLLKAAGRRGAAKGRIEFYAPDKSLWRFVASPDDAWVLIARVPD